MSEADLKMVTEEFERISRECDTREKAIAQLQRAGLLDENGETAAMYRSPENFEAAWQ